MSLNRHGIATIALVLVALLAGCCMPASTSGEVAESTADTGYTTSDHPVTPEPGPEPGGGYGGPYTYCADFTASSVYGS